jgi:hypothetical protein
MGGSSTSSRGFKGALILLRQAHYQWGWGGTRRKTWWSTSPLVEFTQDNLVTPADGREDGLRTIPEGSEA